MSTPLTSKELEKETCKSFGGTNCVLHQCMFGCVLQKAKEEAAKRENLTVISKNPKS